VTLPGGTRLGPYEIRSPLGAGGMGEVYRAKDTRLNRDVAIKVLPGHLAATPEARARFEREARAISSLNHPHICTLYDVGHESGVDYLVMELLEGESLADYLARGPLPLADVLRIGAQVADALDKAHRKGLVHRDLKPGNIVLTKNGAKLLDFGLALARGAGAVSDLTSSPTMARPLTREGTILGTFHYMAPEQLEGKEADARSDLWALGATLYEMATGKRPFEGASQVSLISSIMKDKPRPLVELQPTSPAALDRLIHECLAKDPEDRRQSAGDFKRELDWIAQGGPSGVATVQPESRASKGRSVAVLVTLAATVAGGAGFFVGLRGNRPPESPRVSFLIPAPEGSRFRFAIDDDGVNLAPPALSSDGRRIVFGALDGQGRRMLYLRPVDGFTAQPIAGTEDGRCPFWSPDGASIGFSSNGKLRRLSLSGGPAVALADSTNARGGAWSRKGTILFAPTANSAIFQVPESGGTVSQVTFPDPRIPDISHRWPSFLPDGEHFLFLVWTNASNLRDASGGIFVGSTRARQVTRIEKSPSNAAYVRGRLVFSRERTLVTAPFDLRALKIAGETTSSGEQVQWDPATGLGVFTASDSGSLAYRESGPNADSRLVWHDRGGTQGDSVGPPAGYRYIRLSQDGRRAALAVVNPQGGDSDVWLLDLARGLPTRFTTGPAEDQNPVWSPDGRQVVLASDAEGPHRAFLRPSDASLPEEKLASPDGDTTPLDWSPDGQRILLQVIAGGTDLWVYDQGGRDTKPWLKTGGHITDARFSPDGRWVAYVSDESGRDEVYVRPFPGPGGQYQVSFEGGTFPHWRSDGREIVYEDPKGALMAANVDARGTFQTGVPRRLFSLEPGTPWEAAPDHQRFLVAVRQRDLASEPLRMVVGWADGLEKTR